METTPSYVFSAVRQTKRVRKGGNSVRRAVDTLGAKVMIVKTGEIVGKVHDLLFDREGRLKGLLLEKKNWFAKVPYLPVSQIISIGEDVVTIDKEIKLNADSIEEGWIHLVHGNQKMKGVPVITSRGKQLGILEDVYFQEEMGNIIGYEISDGFFSDLMEGRRTIEHPNKLFIGQDAFVVHQDESESTL
jgi:uncharacterized protein YrrD